MSLISRFFNPDKPELHSHAMAKADSNAKQTMGSGDRTSFEQRQAIERSRRIISNYRSAGVVSSYQRNARPNLTTSDIKPVPSSNNMPRPIANPAPTPIPPRRYDPFA